MQQRKREIKLFLNENKIDILLISETHFTDRSYFNIYKYKTYCTNHPKRIAHGGTAIIINKEISHAKSIKFEDVFLHSTSVEIKDAYGSLVIATVYCLPRHAVNKDKFDKFFDILGVRFISGGECNAKHRQWGSRLSNPKGKELHKIMTSRGYRDIIDYTKI